MRLGIFRPRQVVQRVTANAGNRVFIAGGVGPGRQALRPAPTSPAPAAQPPVQEGKTP